MIEDSKKDEFKLIHVRGSWYMTSTCRTIFDVTHFSAIQGPIELAPNEEGFVDAGLQLISRITAMPLIINTGVPLLMYHIFNGVKVTEEPIHLAKDAHIMSMKKIEEIKLYITQFLNKRIPL